MTTDYISRYRIAADIVGWESKRHGLEVTSRDSISEGAVQD